MVIFFLFFFQSIRLQSIFKINDYLEFSLHLRDHSDLHKIYFIEPNAKYLNLSRNYFGMLSYEGEKKFKFCVFMKESKEDEITLILEEDLIKKDKEKKDDKIIEN